MASPATPPPAPPPAGPSTPAPTPMPMPPRDPRLRIVPPYWHAYSTMAKGRWWNREILELISTEFRDRSLEYYRFALDAGVTTINGRRAQPGDIVRNGDRIQNVVHRHEPPVTGRVQVVSGEKERERHMIVVMKPGSVPVHGAGRYFKNSLVEILKSEFGIEKVYTVNRLDRLTSGLMLLATTASRASQLAKQFAENKVKKEYLARVMGEFPEDELTVSEPLLTIDRQMGLVIVHPEGKPCITVFKRLFYDAESGTSVLHCQPKTGRTHQIRVHLQYLGHPIANDPIYHAPSVWGTAGGKGGIDLAPTAEQRTPSVMPAEAARALNVHVREGEERVDGLRMAAAASGELDVSLEEAVPPVPPLEGGGEGKGSPSDVNPPPPPHIPASDLPASALEGALDPLEPASSSISSPKPATPLTSPTPPAPTAALLPRETGADIGLSSPVPLSAQAIHIIKSLRDQKDRDEDWARWRDVVFRAKEAVRGKYLKGEGQVVGSFSGPKGLERSHYAFKGDGVEGDGAKEGGEAPAVQSTEPALNGQEQQQAAPAPHLSPSSHEEFTPMLDPLTQTLYCPICYSPLHPDPKPEKMYIFLHAWRYETEEGAWASEVPDWAKPEWRGVGDWCTQTT